MKKLTLLTIALLLVMCVLVSCGEIQPRDFVQGNMTITLDSSFVRNTNVAGYSAEFRSSKATVYMLREYFGKESQDKTLTIDSEMSLGQYAEYVLKANQKEGLTLTERGRYLTFIYEEVRNYDVPDYDKSKDVSYTVQVCLFKTVDAFWMISFECPSDSYEERAVEIAEWAASVEFSKESTELTTAVTTEISTVVTTEES